MANAIRQVSTRQGRDAGDFTLFCFGGAAGQHACRVARAAGVRRILVHPLASVLSAFGIGVADRLAVRRASLRQPLDEVGTDCRARRARAPRAAGARASSPPTAASLRRCELTQLLELRSGDSDITLSVPLGELGEVRARFHTEHLRRFGFAAHALAVVIEALRVEARAPSVDPCALAMPPPAAPPGLPERVSAWFGAWREVPLVPVSALRGQLEGPALIVEPHSTVVLEEGWRAQRLPGGELLLSDEATARAARAPAATAANAATADPARIEIYNNLFMHIAGQMGEVLKATAQSVNIRERLDYSCALFDSRGRLVANAPHMPVHLGSMGASVRAVIEARPAGSCREIPGCSTVRTTAAPICRT